MLRGFSDSLQQVKQQQQKFFSGSSLCTEDMLVEKNDRIFADIRDGNFSFRHLK